MDKNMISNIESFLRNKHSLAGPGALLILEDRIFLCDGQIIGYPSYDGSYILDLSPLYCSGIPNGFRFILIRGDLSYFDTFPMRGDRSIAIYRHKSITKGNKFFDGEHVPYADLIWEIGSNHPFIQCIEKMRDIHA